MCRECTASRTVEIMKNKYVAPSMVALVGSLGLMLATVDAKDDKGKGKDKDGHSEKGGNGNKGEKKENKADWKDAKDEAKSDKRDDKNEKRDDKDFDTRKIVRFEDNDRKVILGYFDGHRGRDGGLPPGLVRRGKPLPPGWQDRVVSGYRFDDEWWSSLTPVPYDWFPNMRRDPDTTLYLYGDRIVRVYEPRREVIDVVTVPTIRF